MLKVKGHDGIYRDETTGAIVSRNDIDYNKYINNRDRIKQEKQEIDLLKQDVAEIKNMLFQLLNKG